jgi:hypothetical protein
LNCFLLRIGDYLKIFNKGVIEMDKPCYVTAGIAHSLPEELQAIIWSCFEVLKADRQEQMDYLQVFNLAAKEGSFQTITNNQEEPPMKKRFEINLTNAAPITEKIWVIDSGDYITMLFPHEY